MFAFDLDGLQEWQQDYLAEDLWRRPEALLDKAARASQSMGALLPGGAEERVVRRLGADLRSGEWDRGTHTYDSRRRIRPEPT